MRERLWVWGCVGAVVSGGLMAACFWPLELHWLAWVALVPWLVVLPRVSPGGAWVYGTLLGLVFYRIGLNWGFGVNGPLAGAFIVTLAVWMGFSFRVARLLMDRFSPAAMLWVVPLTFVAQEVLRCEALPRLRFPFLAWGYSQAGNLPVAQIASIGGVYFVSGLLVSASTAIAYGVSRRGWKGWMPAGMVGVGVLVLSWLAQPRGFEGSPRVAVACVQAETFRTARYVELAREAAAGPERPRIIVLPEHAFLDPVDERHSAVQGLAAIARESGAVILVGAHVAAPRNAPCPYDNIGLLIGPDGKTLGRQAKCVPLPFFQDGNPAVGQAVAEVSLGKLGMYVCYDGLFTDHPRRLAGIGAEVFLVPVMDPRNWPEQELRQHAAMAPFRCIEQRRFAVRAASSGVSQVIEASGRVQAQREREEGEGVLHGSVYMSGERTVFACGGYLCAPVVAAAFLAVVGGLTVEEWVGRIRRHA